MLTFQLECKVIRQVSAFMVASKQPESIWVPDFERPKVQYALHSLANVKSVALKTILPQC